MMNTIHYLISHLDFVFKFLVYKNTKEIPGELKDHTNPEVFEKSRHYEMDKSKLGFASSTFSQFESTVSTFLHYLKPLMIIAIDN